MQSCAARGTTAQPKAYVVPSLKTASKKWTLWNRLAFADTLRSWDSLPFNKTVVLLRAILGGMTDPVTLPQEAEEQPNQSGVINPASALGIEEDVPHPQLLVTDSGVEQDQAKGADGPPSQRSQSPSEMSSQRVGGVSRVKELSLLTFVQYKLGWITKEEALKTCLYTRNSAATFRARSSHTTMDEDLRVASGSSYPSLASVDYTFKINWKGAIPGPRTQHVFTSGIVFVATVVAICAMLGAMWVDCASARFDTQALKLHSLLHTYASEFEEISVEQAAMDLESRALMVKSMLESAWKARQQDVLHQLVGRAAHAAAAIEVAVRKKKTAIYRELLEVCQSIELLLQQDSNFVLPDVLTMIDGYIANQTLQVNAYVILAQTKAVIMKPPQLHNDDAVLSMPCFTTAVASKGSGSLPFTHDAASPWPDSSSSSYAVFQYLSRLDAVVCLTVPIASINASALEAVASVTAEIVQRLPASFSVLNSTLNASTTFVCAAEEVVVLSSHAVGAPWLPANAKVEEVLKKNRRRTALSVAPQVEFVSEAKFSLAKCWVDVSTTAPNGEALPSNGTCLEFFDWAQTMIRNGTAADAKVTTYYTSDQVLSAAARLPSIGGVVVVSSFMDEVRAVYSSEIVDTAGNFSDSLDVNDTQSYGKSDVLVVGSYQSLYGFVGVSPNLSLGTLNIDPSEEGVNSWGTAQSITHNNTWRILSRLEWDQSVIEQIFIAGVPWSRLTSDVRQLESGHALDVDYRPVAVIRGHAKLQFGDISVVYTRDVVDVRKEALEMLSVALQRKNLKGATALIVRRADLPTSRVFNSHASCQMSALCEHALVQNESLIIARSDCMHCAPASFLPSSFNVIDATSQERNINGSAVMRHAAALLNQWLGTTEQRTHLAIMRRGDGEEVTATFSFLPNFTAVLVVLTPESVRLHGIAEKIAIAVAIAASAVILFLLCEFFLVRRVIDGVVSGVHEFESQVTTERSRVEMAMKEAVPSMLAEKRIGNRLVSMHAKSASIAVVDICGFSEMSRAWSSLGLVRFIAYYQYANAQVAERYNVLPLNRFGDTVVCVAGIGEGGDVGRFGAFQIAKYGAILTQLFSEAYEHHPYAVPALSNSSFLDGVAMQMPRLRVGMHTGSIVFGTTTCDATPRVDCVGAAMAIASRMQVTCPPGRIHVTVQFREHLMQADLEDIFEFDPPRKTVVKGHSNIVSHFLYSVHLPTPDELLTQLHIEYSHKRYEFLAVQNEKRLSKASPPTLSGTSSSSGSKGTQKGEPLAGDSINLASQQGSTEVGIPEDSTMGENAEETIEPARRGSFSAEGESPYGADGFSLPVMAAPPTMEPQ